MRLLLRIVPVVFVLLSIRAFADNINFKNLSANFEVDPNSGFGDNVSGQLGRSGLSFSGIGGTPGGWFDVDFGSAPGSTGGGMTPILWDSASLKIGSQSYYTDISLEVFGALFASTFTFPTNGKNFSVTLPAYMDTNGTIFCDDEACGTFDLQSKTGKLRLSFIYSADSGLYYGKSGSFVTTPEPGTIGLTGLGIIAITWGMHRRKLAQSSAAA